MPWLSAALSLQWSSDSSWVFPGVGQHPWAQDKPVTVLASQCGDKQSSKEATVLCGLRQVHRVQKCALDVSYNSTFSKILWWKLSIAHSLLWAVKPVLTVSHFYLARRISKLKKMLLAVIVKAIWRIGEQSWTQQLSKGRSSLKGGRTEGLGNL